MISHGGSEHTYTIESDCVPVESFIDTLHIKSLVMNLLLSYGNRAYSHLSDRISGFTRNHCHIKFKRVKNIDISFSRMKLVIV